MLHSVIMAGGSGTRFWPESRKRTPKQLLRLVGERTMIQTTSDRLGDLIPPDRQWVVTNAVQAKGVRTQLDAVPASHVLIEPSARNTAPCVGLAAVHLLAEDPDATMAVMPADHVVSPPEAIQAALSAAADHVAANPDALLLFGVRPTYPAVGYGYIERGEPVADGMFRVASFREKPDDATAAEYVAGGRFDWNCGIFVWRASAILGELRTHEPEMAAGLDEIAASINTAGYGDTLARVFPTLESTSIDYAVLERSDSIVVREATFKWDDIGAWQALPRLHGSDDAGNTVDGDHVGVDTRDCIVRATGGRTIATAGVSDLIIVQTDDATLVADRRDETAVKTLVEELKRLGRDDLL